MKMRWEHFSEKGVKNIRKELPADFLFVSQQAMAWCADLHPNLSSGTEWEYGRPAGSKTGRAGNRL